MDHASTGPTIKLVTDIKDFHNIPLLLVARTEVPVQLASRNTAMCPGHLQNLTESRAHWNISISCARLVLERIGDHANGPVYRGRCTCCAPPRVRANATSSLRAELDFIKVRFLPEASGVRDARTRSHRSYCGSPVHLP